MVKRRKTSATVQKDDSASKRSGKLNMLELLCETLQRDGSEIDLNEVAQLMNAVQKEPLPENARKCLADATAVLQEAVAELQNAIDVASNLATAEAPVAADISQGRDLIGYAHRLSFTTSAPPGFIPGEHQLFLFKPPAPQDGELRASSLHQLQRDYEASKRATERAAAYATTAAATEPATTAAQAEQQPAPAATLAEMLSKLPPMPEGWKPGDAIPGLPPVAAQQLAAAGATGGAAVAPSPPPAAAAQALPSAEGAATHIKQPAVPSALPPPTTKETEKALAAAPAPAAAARPPARPVSAAFDFALNPDMEVEFDYASESESDSDEDSD